MHVRHDEGEELPDIVDLEIDIEVAAGVFQRIHLPAEQIVELSVQQGVFGVAHQVRYGRGAFHRSVQERRPEIQPLVFRQQTGVDLYVAQVMQAGVVRAAELVDEYVAHKAVLASLGHFSVELHADFRHFLLVEVKGRQIGLPEVEVDVVSPFSLPAVQDVRLKVEVQVGIVVHGFDGNAVVVNPAGS